MEWSGAELQKILPLSGLYIALSKGHWVRQIEAKILLDIALCQEGYLEKYIWLHFDGKILEKR